MTGESCEAMGQTMGQMMSGMMDGMMGSGVPWFGLLALGVIASVGAALTWAIVRRPTVDDPREILRRRFARGELSAQDFADGLTALG